MWFAEGPLCGGLVTSGARSVFPVLPQIHWHKSSTPLGGRGRVPFALQ
jgi:hypothetical protein